MIKPFSKNSDQSSLTKKLDCIIFSCDRAMQLDATLRSFFQNCVDSNISEIFVIYKTTTPVHDRQYEILKKEYSLNKQVHFLKEKDFCRDVLFILSRSSRSKGYVLIYRILVLLGRKFRILFRTLIKKLDLGNILFWVDDNIFVKKFSLEKALIAIESNPEVLGFSLRLGKNTTYSYAKQKLQILPEFEMMTPEIMMYTWQDSSGDFAYPLEVSSSIFRKSDILSILNERWFQSPNQLELCLAKRLNQLRHFPKHCCFQQSVTFCNPINKVQNEYDNRSGERISYSVSKLSEQFDLGQRISVQSFIGFIPTSCHQEVELNFIHFDRTHEKTLQK
jgi:hypothetical protein